jgi:hypothetical protein
MRIDSCAFGSIVIDGKKYTSDLILFPDGRVKSHWRRRAGHRLAREDIQELIDAGPDIIVAGIGVSGMVKPETDLERWLETRGIRFLPAANQEAAEIYNRSVSQKKVGACFHLTC